MLKQSSFLIERLEYFYLKGMNDSIAHLITCFQSFWRCLVLQGDGTRGVSLSDLDSHCSWLKSSFLLRNQFRDAHTPLKYTWRLICIPGRKFLHYYSPVYWPQAPRALQTRVLFATYPTECLIMDQPLIRYAPLPTLWVKCNFPSISSVLTVVILLSMWRSCVHGDWDYDLVLSVYKFMSAFILWRSPWPRTDCKMNFVI